MSPRLAALLQQLVTLVFELCHRGAFGASVGCQGDASDRKRKNRNAERGKKSKTNGSGHGTAYPGLVMSSRWPRPIIREEYTGCLLAQSLAGVALAAQDFPASSSGAGCPHRRRDSAQGRVFEMEGRPSSIKRAQNFSVGKLASL